MARVGEERADVPRIAVIGATGTAGSRTVAKLKSRGIDPVEISRSTEVDLVTGAGLREALAGVEVAIDTSNVLPTDHTVGLHEALTGATRHVVEACAAEGVGHLVFLSMIGVEKPELDDIPYYAAKRAQENIVALGPVPATTVKASRFFESATAPDAVTFERDEVYNQRDAEGFIKLNALRLRLRKMAERQGNND